MHHYGTNDLSATLCRVSGKASEYVWKSNRGFSKQEVTRSSLHLQSLLQGAGLCKVPCEWLHGTLAPVGAWPCYVLVQGGIPGSFLDIQWLQLVTCVGLVCSANRSAGITRIPLTPQGQQAE